MKNKWTDRRISPGIVAVALTGAIFAIVTAEVKALQVKERAEIDPKIIGTAACIKCHSDPAMLARMRRKEGGAHFLFNSDGTLRDPKFASYHVLRPVPAGSIDPYLK